MPVPLVAAPINAAIKASKNTGGNTHQVFQPTQGLPKRYQQLSDANPYANVNYRQSWIQKFLSGLGFRTNYDAYLEGMNLQAQEYDNQVLQKQLDEEYNSPLQQALRERQAGLNPNLTGNVSSGEASPLQDDGNPPVPPVADDLQTVTSFAGAVLQGVQAAVGLAGSLQSLTGLKIDNNSKLASFAEDAILHVLPESYDDTSGVDWSSVENYYPKLEKMYGSLMSKRQFRKFVGLANNFAEGLSTGSKKWSLYRNRANERKSHYGLVSGDDYSEVDEVMRGISKELSNLALKLFKERTQADTLNALNDTDYQNMVRPQQNKNAQEYEKGFTGAERASLEKQSANLDLGLSENAKEMSDYELTLRDSYRKILSFLQKKSDDGNTFASIAQAVISALLMGNLPSISVSRSAGKYGMSTSASLK